MLALPVLVVQHIAPGFTTGLAAWLNRSTALTVKVAEGDERVRPATVYVAPNSSQMGITKGGRITLTKEPLEGGFSPSATYLFRSVAEAYGQFAVGILLTGMGRDGVSGLLRMREAGGVTFAQDEETSVVFGMPEEAIRARAAMHVLSPARIANASVGFWRMESEVRPMQPVTSDAAEILIVEDSLTQAEQLKYLLEESGYRVTVAANGKQALALVHKRKPRLIISDILMPEMDGYTLCRTIKSDPATKDIPVILLTSLASPDDVIKVLDSSADNFIHKPYDEKYLLSRVHYILTNRELPKTDTQMGIEIFFGRKRHFITAQREQILNLLISMFEGTIQVNEVLKAKQKELEKANAKMTVMQGELEDAQAKYRALRDSRRPGVK